MSRGSYVYAVSGLFIVFLLLGVAATAYNSIILGNFDSSGVVFHESEDAGTEVVFFHNGELYQFETTRNDLDGQIADLNDQLENKFPDDFYEVYGDFFAEHYNEN